MRPATRKPRRARERTATRRPTRGLGSSGRADPRAPRACVGRRGRARRARATEDRRRARRAHGTGHHYVSSDAESFRRRCRLLSRTSARTGSRRSRARTSIDVACGSSTLWLAACPRPPRRTRPPRVAARAGTRRRTPTPMPKTTSSPSSSLPTADASARGPRFTAYKICVRSARAELRLAVRRESHRAFRETRVSSRGVPRHGVSITSRSSPGTPRRASARTCAARNDARSWRASASAPTPSPRCRRRRRRRSSCSATSSARWAPCSSPPRAGSSFDAHANSGVCSRTARTTSAWRWSCWRRRSARATGEARSSRRRARGAWPARCAASPPARPAPR